MGMDNLVEAISSLENFVTVSEEDKQCLVSASQLYSSFVIRGLIADIRGDEAGRDRAYASARHAALVMSSLATDSVDIMGAIQKVTLETSQKMLAHAAKNVSQFMSAGK